MLLVGFVLILGFCNVLAGENPPVIIIGAGPAGIAAASKFLELNFTNLINLEAENRIGGRIHTINFGEGLVELGAEYCHGERGNIVYELAKNFLEADDEKIENSVYYSNGTKLDVALMKELVPLIYYYNKNSNDSFNSEGKSLRDLFYYRLNSTVEKYKNDKTKLNLVLKEFPRFAEIFIAAAEGAFSWSDLSIDKDYIECEGNQMLIWNKVEYKTIFKLLLKNNSIKNKLYLNSQVTEINWNQSKPITVLTSDNKTYSANYLIFTPSVGVLKLQNNLFNPELPLSKRKSMEATGFAAVMKVFLHFPVQWWNSNDTGFSFSWDEQDLQNINFSQGPNKNKVSWVSEINNIFQVAHNPHVWVGWISGDLIPEIEKLPLETVKSGFAYVLDKFLGNTYNVTEIGEIVMSEWYTNKNFGGVYSFTKTGFYKKGFSHQEMLAEPLSDISGKPKILFAGEATNPVHYSTVHGAIETGFREAERIIKNL